MATTREVLAVMGIIVLTIGTILHYRDQRSAGMALFAAGFGVATLWATLGMLQAQQGAAGLEPETYLSGAASGVAVTLYFAIRSHRLAFGRGE